MKKRETSNEKRATRFSAPRGTKDVLPPESRLWQRLEETFRETCWRFGYEEIRTPTFEDTDLYIGSTGETTDIVIRQMYTFEDRGGRSISLRPEGTPSVIRAFIQHGLDGSGRTYKFYYSCPIFRYERPQKGRLREHHQVGIEALGSPGPEIDGEVIGLAWEFFSSLGLRDLSLRLNSIGCPVCRPTYRRQLLDYFRPWLSEMCEDCQRRFEANPLRILDCKVPRCSELAEGAPGALASLCEDCRAHFDGLKAFLDMAMIGYEIDPRIVRGLDYYTRTVFEIKHGALGAQDALCGGGRYDGLVEACGGKPTPGVGFGAGIERALLALERSGAAIETSAQIISVAALTEEGLHTVLRVVKELRRQGWRCEVDYSPASVGAHLKRADRAGASFALLLGSKELERGEVSIRNMATGEQRSVHEDQVAQTMTEMTNDE